MAVRDDDVIQQLDTEQQAGFEESFRDLMVFVTGSYGSGRMIVSDNNGDCSSQDRSLKDFSGCNRSRIGGTDRDNRIGGHLMRRIQIQSHEVFTAIVRQNGSNEGRHIGGARDSEHLMFAVEIVHSGFANERVLDVGLLNGRLFAGAAAGCCGFCLWHVPQLVVDLMVKRGGLCH